MTVPETELEHKPEIAEAPALAFPGAHPQLTDEERARGRATANATRKAQAQIERLARQAVEALAIEHPETLGLDVGILARLAATRIAADLVAGSVPGSRLHYAAQAVRTLVDVSRLEAGKPTNLTASVTGTATELQTLLDSVRREARAVLTAGVPED